MGNPYWNDERIIGEVDDLSLDENSSDYLEANEKVRRLMRKMRDGYEARIEKIEEDCENRHYKTCMYYVQEVVKTWNKVTRLRALLPDADVRRAIRYCRQATMVATGGNSNYPEIVDAWLDKLEGEVGDG